MSARMEMEMAQKFLRNQFRDMDGIVRIPMSIYPNQMNTGGDGKFNWDMELDTYFRFFKNESEFIL